MEGEKTRQMFQRIKDLPAGGQLSFSDNEGEQTGQDCRIIGFTGAKGGVGTTTVALNVAMALIRTGQRVVHLELSPNGGTAAWLLRMPNATSFGDSSAKLEDINEEFVSQLLMQHSTGLKLLCISPWAPEAGYQVSGELLTVLFRHLRSLSDYLILDFPLEPSVPSMFCLTACHVCNLVLEADAISIARAKTHLEAIRQHSPAQIILTVVNRSGIPPNDGVQGIQEQVGYEVPVMIPFVPELCYTAALKKLPIVCLNPDSVPAQQFLQLGERLCSHFAGENSDSKRDRRFRDRRKSDRRSRTTW